jgi:hypothetical protein
MDKLAILADAAQIQAQFPRQRGYWVEQRQWHCPDQDGFMWLC